MSQQASFIQQGLFGDELVLKKPPRKKNPPDYVRGLFEVPQAKINKEPISQKLKEVVIPLTPDIKNSESKISIPWISLPITMFLLANTFFLVHEQTTFFLLKKYAMWQSIFFAILFESALLLLSYLSGNIPGKAMKFTLHLLLGTSLYVNAMIICTSVEKRDLQESMATEQYQALKREIEVLERKEQTILETVQSMDPVNFVTRRQSTLKYLDDNISPQLEEKRTKLSAMNSIGLVENETNEMKWLRLLSILWNIVLIKALRLSLARKDHIVS